MIAGLVLRAAGILRGDAGYVIAAVGLVPLAAAADICSFATLGRMPFTSKGFCEAANQR
ncbi:MAG: hypothetical protein ABIP36_00035 [Acidimicrobiales bacterium]